MISAAVLGTFFIPLLYIGVRRVTDAEPYPHFVKMGKTDFGMDEIHVDEMVQICMVAPMAADALDWDSEELAALVEYTLVEQEKFQENKGSE